MNHMTADHLETAQALDELEINDILRGCYILPINTEIATKPTCFSSVVCMCFCDVDINKPTHWLTP